MSSALGKRLGALIEAQYPGVPGRVKFRELLEARHDLRVGRSTLASWLSGDRTPELPNLRAILDLLGVHGDDRNEIVALALPSGLLAPNRALDEDETPTECDDASPGAA